MKFFVRKFKKIIFVLSILVVMDFLIAKGFQFFLSSLWDEPQIPHPVYHHGLKPDAESYRCMVKWPCSPFYTNSLGFRDAKVADIPTDTDKTRILILGDSFLEGVGLNYEETVPAILEKHLGENHRVLNGAVTSYSPIIYYRKTKFLLEAGYRFNHVLVFIDISDIHDEARMYQFTPEGNVDHTEEAKKWFRMRSEEYNLPTRIKEFLKRNSTGILLITYMSDMLMRNIAGNFEMIHKARSMSSPRANWTFNKTTLGEYGQEGLIKAQERMSLLSRLLKEEGIRLTVVVYPWPAQIFAHDFDSIQVHTWRKWASQRGHGFINLFPDFLSDHDKWQVVKKYFLKADAHWNERGHAFVAERVAKSWHKV